MHAVTDCKRLLLRRADMGAARCARKCSTIHAIEFTFIDMDDGNRRGRKWKGFFSKISQAIFFLAINL